MKTALRLKLKTELGYQTPSIDEKENDRLLNFLPTEVVAETPNNESPPRNPPLNDDALSTPECRAHARTYFNRFYHGPLARIYVRMSTFAVMGRIIDHTCVRCTP